MKKKEWGIFTSEPTLQVGEQWAQGIQWNKEEDQVEVN